ncbi:hypothetical protein NC653_033978 [Populus alba x Populus x berolinensis]|uniref:Uncharacterized protein n=1 Tax=Populus alba x Populus x berolinensis TaxID=444605 RepID=A0AAD6LUZ4_9ROSI|nr:hypothetical protein NC653_033978 [Populus alba x Populus x berolinensis]
MAKNKRTTHRTTVQNQQQLQVELHNNSVLALAAPPLPPSPPPLTPSPKAVAGGSSPNKFLFFAEEGAVPQSIVSSPSTPDHVIVEDCFEEEDFEDDEVDYSASGDNPSFFHSPLPPSTRHNVDINPNSASRVSPISESGHSVIPEPSPTKRRSSSVPPLQHISPGRDGVDHNIPNLLIQVPHNLQLLLRNGVTYLQPTAAQQQVLNYHTFQRLAMIYLVTCSLMILIIIIMYGSYVLLATLLENLLVLKL